MLVHARSVQQMLCTNTLLAGPNARSLHCPAKHSEAIKLSEVAARRAVVQAGGLPMAC
jgi:hypothetical protein